MTSTLQRLVSGVVRKIVVFVLLEQVAGVHLVAVLHKTLWSESQSIYRITSVNESRNAQHGAEKLRPTSSLTSRAEHCRGTDIILCGFHVTELALQFKKTTQKEPTIIHRYIKCSLAYNICPFGAEPHKTVTCLSTPSSFHRCLLDMSRLPPHAPWNTKRWKTLASTFNKPSMYKTDGEILRCLNKNGLSQSFHNTKKYCCSK